LACHPRCLASQPSRDFCCGQFVDSLLHDARRWKNRHSTCLKRRGGHWADVWHTIWSRSCQAQQWLGEVRRDMRSHRRGSLARCACQYISSIVPCLKWSESVVRSARFRSRVTHTRVARCLIYGSKICAADIAHGLQR